METFELSRMFFVACDRMHDAVDELYEALHKLNGEPIEKLAGIEESIGRLRNAIYHEIDLINSSISENESD